MRLDRAQRRRLGRHVAPSMAAERHFENSAARGFDGAHPRRRDLRHNRPRGRRLALCLPAVVGVVAFSLIGATFPPGTVPDTDGDVAQAIVPSTSALEVLDSAAAARQAQRGDTRDDPLAIDETASARAAVIAASRASERGSLADVDRANGAMAAVLPEQDRRSESPPQEAVPEREEVVMPLAGGASRVSSQYGYRSGPFGGESQFHTGVDLAAPLDTPIRAVTDGVVDYVGPGKDGRSSMLIILEHVIDGRTYYTWYNHMYTSGLYVQPGQEVSAGEVIAGVGNNGNSTGPHLHFEVHTDAAGTSTEPLSWLQQQGAQ